MKELIVNLNKHFESRIRLGIMSVLMVNDWVDFSSLKETLTLTDGNLASHIKALENESYVEVKKQFLGRKPNTSYRATIEGRRAFEEHLAALENLIKTNK
ncbi:MAG TPA: transcriptional regulator [Tenuifilaceae bacterium]|nr:transcriptional regulator [Tenuifilaceae bacterium]HPE19308.1 transcriptional regulator [Tenuifilaceae bacterium]HPJ46860.1 transcriptional regulator [Tenuifilaceae bacterium]HPQ35309.1 transcriptional regulator [Tenuifilaceae bacterium]HRX69047.1 transcriptional regulator [Tenuifilaceae bacterium]